MRADRHAPRCCRHPIPAHRAQIDPRRYCGSPFLAITSPALHLCIVSIQVKSLKRWGDDSGTVPSHRNFQYLDWFALVQLPKGRESPSHAAKDSHSWRRYGSPSAGRPHLLHQAPASTANAHDRSPRSSRGRPDTRRAPRARPAYRRSAAVVPPLALVRGFLAVRSLSPPLTPYDHHAIAGTSSTPLQGEANQIAARAATHASP